MARPELHILADQLGFSHTAPIAMDALVLYPEVREMCSADRCKNYDRSWSCPPACGTLEVLERRVRKYSKGILLQSTGTMADAFDLEAIRKTEAEHRTRFAAIARQARQLYPGCLPMGSGGCRLCTKCTYPSRPCRFPQKVFPSMEACGLLVSEVCAKSQLTYYYGPNTITYTACILYD